MFRIDADRQEHSGKLQRLRAELLGLLVNRDRVQVDDAVNALVVVLNFGPILQRTQIVADMRTAGGLNAGKNSCSHGDVEETSIVNDARAAATPEAAETVEVGIEKWVYGGEALARIPTLQGGRALLAPYVLPGETVRLSVRDDIHAFLRTRPH